MVRKQFCAVAVICSGIWLMAAEPEHFRITPADEGMITREFIAQIRSGVGDEKASRASQELDDFVHQLMGKAGNRMDYEDLKCCYLNYLERLYHKALKAAAKALPPKARAELLRQEKEWEKKGPTSYDYEIKYDDGHPAIDVDSRNRAIRYYLNRTRYLECPPPRRAELARFHGLRVPYVRGGSLPIEYNELRRVTPLDVLESNRQTRGKTYVEDIATLPPEFCREVKVGKDLYQMGILIPTNDSSGERSTQDYSRILVIWKNRKHHAHYYLPHHSVIEEIKVHKTQVSVRYLQVEDFVSETTREKNVGQTFTIDFTYEIYAAVRITNWLDYYMDGLGNIHTDGCCKGKFQNPRFVSE
jgi:hypothetical protein